MLRDTKVFTSSQIADAQHSTTIIRETMSGSRQRKAEGNETPRVAQTLGNGSSSAGTGGYWFQCILVAVVSSTTFAFFYYPSLRHSIGRDVDPGLKWWQTSIIYQIYPRSFQDSDGDGVGDIKGITSRLDYLQYIGVETVWISPVYKSPMADFGYDVEDFTDVDPLFGSLDDLDDLINALHKRGMKIIMDFIPNHTSNLHKWFLESRKGGEANKYADYYIWHPGKKLANGTVVPPNNWVSVFGGSMWEWDESRKEYYLHQFTKEQPDLNFWNGKVQEEIKAALMFWLEKGVDGFRIDALRHMYEDKDFSKNNPLSNIPGTTPDQYEHYLHPHTTNKPETHEVLRSWRNMFDLYSKDNGKDIFMVVEVFDNEVKNVIPYYHSGANFPFNFGLQALNKTCDGFCFKRIISGWMDSMPSGKWPNWVLGSHDVARISAKMGPEMASSMNMLLLLLPGTPVTYYGEEIAMQNVHVPFELSVDPAGLNFGPKRYMEFSRDPCRSPMQWSATKNSGFSTSDKTWLPIHPNYLQQNVEVQMNELSGFSPLQLYRHLALLRRQKTLTQGGFQFAVINKNIFSFIRYLDDYPNYLVAMNIGNEPSTDNYRDFAQGDFPPQSIFIPYRGYVVHTTGPFKLPGLEPRQVIILDKITLHPGEGVVIRFWSAF